MKRSYFMLAALMIVVLALAACGGGAAEPTAAPAPTEAPAPEPTEPPAAEPEPEPTEAPAEAPAMAGLSCAEPIKIGLITDLTGGLAIYGTMAERAFQLGMEYATGVAAGDDGVYKLGDCEIQVLVRDDQGSAENTATLARELIDVEDVDILVGTVSSGSTASLQEIAHENDVVLIVAPAAANDITGVNFNEHTFRTSR